jgi:hypothetical protein
MIELVDQVGRRLELEDAFPKVMALPSSKVHTPPNCDAQSPPNFLLSFLSFIFSFR